MWCGGMLGAGGSAGSGGADARDKSKLADGRRRRHLGSVATVVMAAKECDGGNINLVCQNHRRSTVDGNSQAARAVSSRPVLRHASRRILVARWPRWYFSRTVMVHPPERFFQPCKMGRTEQMAR